MSSASLVLVINCGSSSLRSPVILRNQGDPGAPPGWAEKLGLHQGLRTLLTMRKGRRPAVTRRCQPYLRAGGAVRPARRPGRCRRSAPSVIRVAYGGMISTFPVRLTASVIERIRELSAALAPLHNPANLGLALRSRHGATFAAGGGV